jgi:SAM-dependent methyltransferase
MSIPLLVKWQPIKSKAYLWFHRSVAPRLGDSLPAIRLKWLVALKLVGLEFHLENITRNRDKLLRYLDPDRPLLEPIAEAVSQCEDDTILLLDLGCGPFPKTGIRYDGKRILKQSLDPLAAQYRACFTQLRLPNPPEIKQGFAEKLTALYPSNHFHVIYARNCIDHCYNPASALQQMLNVLRSRGCIIMQHFLNEGTRACGYGLHQWNLTLNGGDLWVANRTSSIRVNLSQRHRNSCDIQSRCDGEKVFCKIQKF